MNWKRWKLGCFVSLVLSLFVASAGLAQGVTWRQFAATLAAALLTHFGAFLKDHPVESIEFDSEKHQETSISK